MPTSSKNKKVFELSLTSREQSPGSSELLTHILSSAGVSLSDIIESREGSSRWVSTYLNSAAKARVLQQKLQRLPMKNIAVTLRTLYQAEWRDKWKRDFQPFALTKTIDVVPVWGKKDYVATSRLPILIDTVTAFGTGLHETTRFLSQLIEQCRGKFESFLDIGTGTGLLTMVALKSGAKEIVAVDIDRQCATVARRNFAVNGYPSGAIKAMDIMKLKTKKRFDFVAANLTTHDLIRMRRKIISLVQPGGFLGVSGISLENFARLKKSFKTLPLRCLKIKKGKDWVAILYKRIR